MSNSSENDENGGGQAVSRRDFLRRASKEAVTTGVSLVPGAHLAQTALGVATGASAGEKRSWWQRLLVWRRERTADSAQTREIEE